ncbi:MAG: hypothetical protein KAS32_14425 [Candidatus Peribacteraceae bacterium]|nr:hypothetical protein [Candidatus Peribacteraceae bacterium]
MPFFSMYNEDKKIFEVIWDRKKPKGVMLMKGTNRWSIENATQFANEDIGKRTTKKIIQQIDNLNKKGDI